MTRLSGSKMNAQRPWLDVRRARRCIFGLWIVVDQSAKPSNLLVGVLASAAAAWVSLKLLPPASGRVRLGLLLLLLPRFLCHSLVAGMDVARRAFAPQLDLQPGFIEYRARCRRARRATPSS